jgi:hypothetical protein
MSINKLLAAASLLIALLGLTVWQWSARSAEDDRAADVSVTLPKLKKEDIDELSIAAPGKTPVAFKKNEQTWQLTAPLAARADQSNVDTVLSKLAELEVVSVAATKADNHDKLDVTDAKGVHVIAKQQGKPVLDLLIGAYRSGNTAVREPSKEGVASAKGSIKYAFDKDVKDWRDRAILDVKSDDVQAIRFEGAQGTFRFVKDGKDFKQAPSEKGEHPLANLEPTKVFGLVNTVASLRAEDFAAPEVTPEAAGVAPKADGTVVLTAKVKDAEQELTLRVGHQAGDRYYVKRDDTDTLFLVSKFTGERLLASKDRFVKDEPPKAAAAVPPGGKTAVASAGKKP